MLGFFNFLMNFIDFISGTSGRTRWVLNIDTFRAQACKLLHIADFGERFHHKYREFFRGLPAERYCFNQNINSQKFSPFWFTFKTQSFLFFTIDR